MVEIQIKGTPKEIADLVREIQDRQSSENFIPNQKECNKYNFALQAREALQWVNDAGHRINSALVYDQENDVIIVSKEKLMRLIMIVNPAQSYKELRFESDEEVRKRRDGRKIDL